MDHLLIHFPIAKDLWDMLLCLLAVSWVTPHFICAMLESWQGIGRTGRCGDVARPHPSCGAFGKREIVVLLMGQRLHCLNLSSSF